MAKLLVLAAIVAAVWYGFRWYQRTQQVRQSADEDKVARRSDPEIPPSEDLVACRQCGTYVSAEGRQSCGRADCPF